MNTSVKTYWHSCVFAIFTILYQSVKENAKHFLFLWALMYQMGGLITHKKTSSVTYMPVTFRFSRATSNVSHSISIQCIQFQKLYIVQANSELRHFNFNFKESSFKIRQSISNIMKAISSAILLKKRHIPQILFKFKHISRMQAVV